MEIRYVRYGITCVCSEVEHRCDVCEVRTRELGRDHVWSVFQFAHFVKLRRLEFRSGRNDYGVEVYRLSVVFDAPGIETVEEVCKATRSREWCELYHKLRAFLEGYGDWGTARYLASLLVINATRF